MNPHEIKTIITRAGENTKIIFTGDIYQIDTPYLDSQSNGLSYLIDRIQNHPIYAHITLQKGERSELANIANELLWADKLKLPNYGCDQCDATDDDQQYYDPLNQFIFPQDKGLFSETFMPVFNPFKRNIPISSCYIVHFLSLYYI